MKLMDRKKGLNSTFGRTVYTRWTGFDMYDEQQTSEIEGWNEIKKSYNVGIGKLGSYKLWQSKSLIHIVNFFLQQFLTSFYSLTGSFTSKPRQPFFLCFFFIIIIKEKNKYMLSQHNSNWNRFCFFFHMLARDKKATKWYQLTEHLAVTAYMCLANGVNYTAAGVSMSLQNILCT